MTSQASPANDPDGCRQAIEAERWLDEHGDVLYRYARTRVGHSELAEDLVQETLLAALAARDRFQGQSAIRTWLLAILKRKILDHYRRKSATPHPNETHPERDGPQDPLRRRLFDADGFFRQTPAPWKTPPEMLETREFWAVLDACLRRLPSPLASVFALRELEERPVDEIQRVLGLSPGNLRVRLYRARLLLRECLERRWFVPDPEPAPHPEPPSGS
jgi:RNA polymerase sigma-70 factor (ECF subfamily)